MSEDEKMRRAILALVAVAALVVPIASVAADTTGGGGSSFKYSQTGKGADAAWSTFPADGQFVVGTVYTDTFVSTSEQAVKADGTVYSDKFVFIDQIGYTIDRIGNFNFVSETFGFAGGSDVTLSIAKSLASGSVAANISLVTCTVDRRGNYTCVDSGIGTLAASWTGQGDLIRQSGSFHTVSKGFTDNYKFRGTFRNATATGSLNGTAIGGQLYFADLFSASSREVFVCHGPGSC